MMIGLNFKPDVSKKYREFLGAIAEIVPHGRKAQGAVQVFANELDEEVVDGNFVRAQPFGFAFRYHGVEEVVQIFAGEQIGNVATGEQVVQKDQKALVRDLRISHQEHDAFVLDT